MDVKKLPVFAISKGEHGERVEKLGPLCVQDRMFAAVQKKAWMDNRVMSIWFEKVYEPYGHHMMGTRDFYWMTFCVTNLRSHWMRSIAIIHRCTWSRLSTQGCCSRPKLESTSYSKTNCRKLLLIGGVEGIRGWKLERRLPRRSVLMCYLGSRKLGMNYLLTRCRINSKDAATYLRNELNKTWTMNLKPKQLATVIY